MSKHICLCILFIRLTTTCFGHCGPQWPKRVVSLINRECVSSKTSINKKEREIK